MKLSDIQMRDPFVLPVASEGLYYLYGSTDKDIWKGPGVGFDVYRSRDLAANDWEGPLPAFRPPQGFWGHLNFWAPEVHLYRGRYYMFASFKAHGVPRGTAVLVADSPAGPFLPWSDGPLTPRDHEALDGTLYIDRAGHPWMVFCHEWVQIGNGTIEAIRLSEDLKTVAGPPITLFTGASAPWVRKLIGHHVASAIATYKPDPAKGLYVTDGPFLHRTAAGVLLLLWSSFGNGGYAMGLARSMTGEITGPWVHQPDPLWPHDGGHGMIFKTFEGVPHLTLHHPNVTPNERPLFHPLTEFRDTVQLTGLPIR